MVTTPGALPMANVSTGLEPHLTTVRDRFPSPYKVSPEHEDERMMACSRKSHVMEGATLGDKTLREDKVGDAAQRSSSFSALSMRG